MSNDDDMNELEIKSILEEQKKPSVLTDERRNRLAHYSLEKAEYELCVWRLGMSFVKRFRKILDETPEHERYHRFLNLQEQIEENIECLTERICECRQSEVLEL